MKLEDIKKLVVHWSENEHINMTLGVDDNCDIEKEVDVYDFDKMLEVGSRQVAIGYDKTSLSVWTDDGLIIDDVKFNLTKLKPGLLQLINN